MRALIRHISFLLLVIAGVMTCLMMLHITADAFLKYAFNRPLYGTVEVVQFYYMIGAIYLPLAYAQLRDRHISVELFADYFPAPLRRISEAAVLVLTGIFFAMLTYQGWLDALTAFAIGEQVMGSTTIPIWPTRFFLPISFALVTLVTVLRIVDEVVLGRRAPTTSSLQAVD